MIAAGRPAIRVVLQVLQREGGYRSEKQLAEALGEKQQTVNAWKRAKSWPGRFQLALQRFAVTHGYDLARLLERGELVKASVAGQAPASAAQSSRDRPGFEFDSPVTAFQLLTELQAIRVILAELLQKVSPADEPRRKHQAPAPRSKIRRRLEG